jgi:hypothetical protein
MALWIAHSGVNRSKSYEMIAQKELRAFKNGRQLLIDIEHGLQFLRSLPPAEIRPRNKPRKRSTPLDAPGQTEEQAESQHPRADKQKPKKVAGAR